MGVREDTDAPPLDFVVAIIDRPQKNSTQTSEAFEEEEEERQGGRISGARRMELSRVPSDDVGAGHPAGPHYTTPHPRHPHTGEIDYAFYAVRPVPFRA